MSYSRHGVKLQLTAYLICNHVSLVRVKSVSDAYLASDAATSSDNKPAGDARRTECGARLRVFRSS